MAWEWRLGPTVNSYAVLYPQYDYKAGGNKIESRHRTQDGSQYVYQWGAFDRIDFSVNYVSSTHMSVVNSWWGANTDLIWMQVDSSNTVVQTHSVHISNKSKPITQHQKPYIDQFKGKLTLETY